MIYLKVYQIHPVLKIINSLNTFKVFYYSKLFQKIYLVLLLLHVVFFLIQFIVLLY